MLALILAIAILLFSGFAVYGIKFLIPFALLAFLTFIWARVRRLLP